MDGGLGLTITGMRNVTIKTEDPSKNYTGAFYGALKVTNCPNPQAHPPLRM